jgi:hypothetical protein
MRSALQQLRTQAGDMAVRAQAAADDAAAQRAEADAAAQKAAEELAAERGSLAALQVRTRPHCSWHRGCVCAHVTCNRWSSLNVDRLGA